MLQMIRWTALAILLSVGGWLSWYFAKADLPTPPSGAATLIYDVSQLNPIAMTQVYAVRNETELAAFLQRSQGPISIGGGRYSQGGHTAILDGVQLDMRTFNQVLAFDPVAKQIRVQAGMRWSELQRVIDPHQLAVKIMQTYANFTIGGSVSVNAHGRYVGQGALVHSILALRLMLADGQILELSPQQQPEIFYAVIGGYGGLGVILDVTLQLTDNSKVKRHYADMPLADYAAWFATQRHEQPSMVFHNADLFPPRYNQVRAVSWLQTDEPVTEPQRLHPQGNDYRYQARLVDFVADYPAGKWLRQHVFEPLVYQADTVHWRNFEASYDVAELEPVSRQDFSYGLREYFVPVDQLQPFVARMASIFEQHHVNVLNVSIRHAKADPHTLLSWSPTEVFCLVVYYRQGTDSQAQQATDAWSQAMVEASIAVGGRYYLPYQRSATVTQFSQAYPGIIRFAELKQQLDPNGRFTNAFWQKYLPK